MKRQIIAEFYKNPKRRFELFSLTAIEKVTGHDGKQHLQQSGYDVDLSRQYGYIFHMSSAGHFPLAVSGPYYASEGLELVEKPCLLCGADCERNRTRRLRKLPKGFDLEQREDLLDWLENNAIESDAVYCSICRDWFPGDNECDLCEHVWWCDATGWYSTPTERCGCANREECRAA